MVPAGGLIALTVIAVSIFRGVLFFLFVVILLLSLSACLGAMVTEEEHPAGYGFLLHEKTPQFNQGDITLGELRDSCCNTAPATRVAWDQELPRSLPVTLLSIC